MSPPLLTIDSSALQLSIDTLNSDLSNYSSELKEIHQCYHEQDQLIKHMEARLFQLEGERLHWDADRRHILELKSYWTYEFQRFSMLLNNLSSEIASIINTTQRHHDAITSSQNWQTSHSGWFDDLRSYQTHLTEEIASLSVMMSHKANRTEVEAIVADSMQHDSAWLNGTSSIILQVKALDETLQAQSKRFENLVNVNVVEDMKLLERELLQLKHKLSEVIESSSVLNSSKCHYDTIESDLINIRREMNVLRQRSIPSPSLAPIDRKVEQRVIILEKKMDLLGEFMNCFKT